MRRLLDSFYFNFFLSLLWIIVSVYFFSSKFDINGTKSFPLQDKFFHFFDFFIMSYLVLRTLKKSNLVYNLNSKIITLVLLLLFSIMVEYNQSFISYRTFDIHDMISNMLGVIASYFVKIK